MSLDPRRARVVDAQTTEFLRRNPNFARLSAAQQADTIRAMSTIVRTMADSARASDPYSPHAMGLDDVGTLTAPTDPNQIQTVSGGAKELIAKQGTEVGSVIGAGVTQTARMVKEINFPQFVASLIDGTFKAIVTSSIEQMKAYAEMVKSVSASLNDFKDKNTTDDEARQSLVSRYPQLMQMQVVDGVQKVMPRDDAFGEDMPDFGKDLGMSQNVTSLDEDTIEQQLVPAARDDLARGRQQLLATTILMGINRIIVTDGKINARIRFKFDAVEKRTTQSTARDLATDGEHDDVAELDARAGRDRSSRTASSRTTRRPATTTRTTTSRRPSRRQTSRSPPRSSRRPTARSPPVARCSARCRSTSAARRSRSRRWSTPTR